MTIEEFIDARVAEMRDQLLQDIHRESDLGHRVVGLLGIVTQITELSRNWPVLIERPPRMPELSYKSTDEYVLKMTQQYDVAIQSTYKARYGVEPPTAPMTKAVAAIWSYHPDYNPDWSNG